MRIGKKQIKTLTGDTWIKAYENVFPSKSIAGLVSEANILNEDFADISDWTNDDYGTGAESLALTFDSKTCVRMKTGTATNGSAARTRDVGSFGVRTVVEFSLYIVTASPISVSDAQPFVYLSDGARLLAIYFGSDNVAILNTAGSRPAIGSGLPQLNTWQTWLLDMNWVTGRLDLYLNGSLAVSNVDFGYAYTGYVNGYTRIENICGTTGVEKLCYFDWMKISNDGYTSTTIGGLNGNYMANSNFEGWAAGTSTYPDNWLLYYSPGGGTVNRESTNVKVGTYSCKIVNTGGTQYALYNNLFSAIGFPASFWQGKTVSFGCWVKTNTASEAYLKLNDGTADYYSTIHTGSGNWEWLSVTATLSGSATGLYPIILVDAPTVTTAYFDGAIFMIASSVPQVLDSTYALDGNLDKNYRLLCRFVNGFAGSTEFQIYPNNDTTANYDREGLYGINTTAGSYKNAAFGYVFLTAADTSAGNLAMADCSIYSASGYLRPFMISEIQTINGTTIGAVAESRTIWRNTTDNITSFVLKANQTGGIGAGSSIELWRRANKI